MQVKPFQPVAAAATHMRIDGSSMENLELLRGPDRSQDGSLLQVLDRCSSHGGKRLLRAWLCRPLCDVELIQQRQAVVQMLQGDEGALGELPVALRRFPDLARCFACLLPPAALLPQGSSPAAATETASEPSASLGSLY